MPEMNDVIADICKRLRKEFPDVDTIIDGVHGKLPESEYDDLVVTWAQNAYSYGFERLRSRRNILLSESDWTQQPDAPVDTAAWGAYRQALRDLPATIKDPTVEIKWPEPPK
jgi:hypothetical protein